MNKNIITAHISCSIGTPSEHYTAWDQACNGALDYDVTITIGTVEIEGSVTLYRDVANGGMSTGGAPLDGWCSIEIVHLAHSLTDASRKALLGELAALCAGPLGESEIELSEPTAEQHGADDAETIVSDSQINAGSDDDGPAAVAARMLRPSSGGSDEALINALGWEGVYKLAWLAYDRDADHPSPAALAWCERYSAGYNAQLAEIAAAGDDSDSRAQAVCS